MEVSVAVVLLRLQWCGLAIAGLASGAGLVDGRLTGGDWWGEQFSADEWLK
jgi:hypothetical protein